MFSGIRGRLTYANVVVTLALVFAMSGGAYAAKHYLITSTKQISPKVLKALQGKALQGKAGPTGAVGSTGPAGAQGPTGVQGKEGLAGKEGPQGVPGKDGKDGQTGFTETLPKGKTLKGSWSMSGLMPGTGPIEGSASTAVSFGIPLAEAPEPASVKAPTKEEEEKHEFPTPPAGCTGNVEEPGAEPGHLCVFARAEYNVVGTPWICSSAKSVVQCILREVGVEGTAGRSGFVMLDYDQAAGLIAVNGTWAVTAE